MLQRVYSYARFKEKPKTGVFLEALNNFHGSLAENILEVKNTFMIM